MDKEYIERRAALLSITNDGCTASNVGALMRVPAADVVEVVHGEWDTRILKKSHSMNVYSHICNRCGAFYTDTKPTAYKYCFNCGAKMDGKDGEGK